MLFFFEVDNNAYKRLLFTVLSGICSHRDRVKNG